MYTNVLYLFYNIIKHPLQVTENKKWDKKQRQGVKNNKKQKTENKKHILY